MRHPDDAFAFLQRLIQGPAKRYRHVLDSMVGIDVQVAPCPDHQVEKSVLCQLLQEMIEEAYPSADLKLARPVDGKLDGNRCLLRVPRYVGLPGANLVTSVLNTSG